MLHLNLPMDPVQINAIAALTVRLGMASSTMADIAAGEAISTWLARAVIQKKNKVSPGEATSKDPDMALHLIGNESPAWQGSDGSPQGMSEQMSLLMECGVWDLSGIAWALAKLRPHDKRCDGRVLLTLSPMFYSKW